MRWIILTVLLIVCAYGRAQFIPNMRTPLVVSHVPERNALMLRRAGAPKHNFITKIICFKWKCRAKIGWHKTQQRNKFKKYKNGPSIPRLKYLKQDSTRKLNKPAVKDSVAAPAPLLPPVKKDSTVALVFDDVLFDTNSSDLRDEFMDQLDTMVTHLKKSTNYCVRVIGHTDNSGSEKENMRLSQERAESVALYISSRGINRKVITAEGKGSTVPIADNATIEGKRKNRRVEVILSFQ